ncbi:MAG: MATE family efflux transporter, partial [Rhodospirillaceae bacterium]|nr:MATE family efflux transporter [Rhodospirillaceae bacterium]
MNIYSHSKPGGAGSLASWRRESTALAALAVPIALTMLSHIAMVTTDVVMMGWLGPRALAAGALANHYYWLLDMGAMGLLGSLAAILAQHIGARRFRMVRRAVRQGFWVAIVVAIPCLVAMWHSGAVLGALGQDAVLAAMAQDYLRHLSPGFVPLLGYIVVASFMTAHGRPRPSMVLAIIGIFVNGIADYALMFGNFGFPDMGLAGAGLSSAVVAILMFIGLATYALTDRRLRRYRLLGRFWRPDWAQFWEIFTVGLPIGIAALAGIGLFAAAALLMGLLGTEQLAAHAIAVQCCAIAYMIPNGISRAATVRVGWATGAGDHRAAARSGWTALGLGCLVMCLPAAAFWLLGPAIVALFLEGEAAPAGIAVGFLAVAAIFQFADGAQ